MKMKLRSKFMERKFGKHRLILNLQQRLPTQQKRNETRMPMIWDNVMIARKVPQRWHLCLWQDWVTTLLREPHQKLKTYSSVINLPSKLQSLEKESSKGGRPSKANSGLKQANVTIGDSPDKRARRWKHEDAGVQKISQRKTKAPWNATWKHYTLHEKETKKNTEHWPP